MSKMTKKEFQKEFTNLSKVIDKLGIYSVNVNDVANVINDVFEDGDSASYKDALDKLSVYLTGLTFNHKELVLLELDRLINLLAVVHPSSFDELYQSLVIGTKLTLVDF